MVDRDAGRVGRLDLDIFTEYGQIMQARRTTPVINANQNVFFTDRLELLMEVGKIDEQGEDPKASIRWSDNGGVSFDMNWITMSLGMIGQYRQRLTIWQLGQAQDRVYDLKITDNVRRTLIDCVIEGEVGEV
jgi:hypothetical protein